MSSDRLFLARAVELALHNADSGAGGPFGAVVVRDGRIIGEGCNQVVPRRDPTAHAEVMAIRAACAASDSFHLQGTTLYASSEPCPLCLAAAYWARIERIVFANSRAEAAAIGFCDDELYCQLALPMAERTVRMEHLALPDALQPLQRWAANPARTEY